MFGSEILEVGIGTIFVFLLVSIICSAIREGIEAWTHTRAAYLERGIRELLHDPDGEGLARHFYEHPLIYGLYASRYSPGAKGSRLPIMENGRELPTYIPAANFASALMDIAARGPDLRVESDPEASVLSLESIRSGILNIGSPPVQRILLIAVDTAQGDLDRARKNLEAWFDSGMDRVSGWYKRSTHWIIFWIGLAVAVGLNVNALTIADHLYRNDAARAAIVARAEAAVADTGFLRRGYPETRQELDSLGLPIGWTRGWGAPRREGDPGAGGVWNVVIGPVLGWLLTALAATMGAPFWFDVLNKFIVIRSTVKPHEKSPEEASEDRQKKREPGSGASPSSSPSTTQAATVNTPGTQPSAAASAPGGAAPVTPVSGAHAPDAMDGCDVAITRVTRDEELPEARGGVA